MDILVAIGKFLLVGLAVAGVAHPLYAERRNYHFAWRVYKRFRFGLFAQALAVQSAVMAVGVGLTYVPFLEYGWLSLFYDGGGGMLVRPVLEGSVSESEFLRALPLLFFIALLAVLPFLAEAEEEIFRRGYEEWKGILWQSFKFGLMHCLVGVPLAFGIALTLTGLFCAYHYKRELNRRVRIVKRGQAEDDAVMASTVAHTICNAIAVGFLLIYAFTML